MNERRPEIILVPLKVVRVLGGSAILLILANAIGLFMINVLGHDSVYGLVPLFDLDEERNIPTLFAVFLFLINGSLLFMVGWVGRMRRDSHWVWIFLSVLFGFLALDEFASFHEKLTPHVRQWLGASGFLHFSWVIPYGIGCLAVAAAFFPVWRRLDRSVRRWFGLSAATYISGAIGFEMIGGWYRERIDMQTDWIYGIIFMIEESLEMAGLILMVYSLLLLLQSRFNGIALSIPGPRGLSGTTDQ